MLQATQSSVQYASRTKLLDLAYSTAQKQNLKKVQAEIAQGSKIFYWLRALDYDAYLTQEQREKIWYCLIELADINDFPIAPTLGTVNRPNINVGGTTTITNNNTYSDGTPFENTDVDTGTETVVSIPVTDDYGAIFHYTIRNGVNQRSGVVIASWLSNGSSVVYSEDCTEDIGDTSDVTLSVDYNSGNIRLLATATSNNWTVEGKYYLIHS